MTASFNLIANDQGYVLETESNVYVYHLPNGKLAVSIGHRLDDQEYDLTPATFYPIQRANVTQEVTEELTVEKAVEEIRQVMSTQLKESRYAEAIEEHVKSQPPISLLALPSWDEEEPILISSSPNNAPTQLNASEAATLPLKKVTVPVPDVIRKAQEAVENIDVVEVKEEFEQQAKLLNDKPLLAGSYEELAKRAQDSIIALDKEISEGGRVNVSDKYLLNCRADLNQLVPFKYSWAWSLYLTSCDKHWMPSEYNLTKDRQEFHNLLPSVKAILLRAWYNHQYQAITLPVDSVLNCYRLVTNPECRQYILRQAFEMCLTKHAWLFITQSLISEETLAVHPISEGGPKLRTIISNTNDTFVDRCKAIQGQLRNIHSQEFDTTNIEDMRQFVIELLVGLGYVNWIMHLPAYYQVLNITRTNGSLKGVREVILMMLKDIKTQSEHLKLLIEGIIKENPAIVTLKFKAHLIKVFTEFFNLELDLVSLSCTTQTEYPEIKQLLSEEIGNLLSIVDVNFSKTNTTSGDIYWFKDLINDMTPAVDHSVTIGGGSLSFDS